MINDKLTKELQEQITENKDDINIIKNNSVYSTSETICGTWNGKPLYRKTFSGNLGQTSTINHGISNIDLVISIHGSYKNTETGTQFNIPSVRPAVNNYEIGIYANQSTITFDKAPGISGDMLIFNVIMEYTKTTD